MLRSRARRSSVKDLRDSLATVRALKIAYQNGSEIEFFVDSAIVVRAILGLLDFESPKHPTDNVDRMGYFDSDWTLIASLLTTGAIRNVYLLPPHQLELAALIEHRFCRYDPSLGSHVATVKRFVKALPADPYLKHELKGNSLLVTLLDSVEMTSSYCLSWERTLKLGAFSSKTWAERVDEFVSEKWIKLTNESLNEAFYEGFNIDFYTQLRDSLNTRTSSSRGNASANDAKALEMLRQYVRVYNRGLLPRIPILLVPRTSATMQVLEEEGNSFAREFLLNHSKKSESAPDRPRIAIQDEKFFLNYFAFQEYIESDEDTLASKSFSYLSKMATAVEPVVGDWDEIVAGLNVIDSNIFEFEKIRTSLIAERFIRLTSSMRPLVPHDIKHRVGSMEGAISITWKVPNIAVELQEGISRIAGQMKDVSKKGQKQIIARNAVMLIKEGLLVKFKQTDPSLETLEFALRPVQCSFPETLLNQISDIAQRILSRDESADKSLLDLFAKIENLTLPVSVRNEATFIVLGLLWLSHSESHKERVGISALIIHLTGIVSQDLLDTSEKALLLTFKYLGYYEASKSLEDATPGRIKTFEAARHGVSLAHFGSQGREVLSDLRNVLGDLEAGDDRVFNRALMGFAMCLYRQIQWWPTLNLDSEIAQSQNEPGLEDKDISLLRQELEDVLSDLVRRTSTNKESPEFSNALNLTVYYSARLNLLSRTELWNYGNSLVSIKRNAGSRWLGAYEHTIAWFFFRLALQSFEPDEKRIDELKHCIELLRLAKEYNSNSTVYSPVRERKEELTEQAIMLEDAIRKRIRLVSDRS